MKNNNIIHETNKREIEGVLLENWFLTHIEDNNGFNQDKIQTIINLIDKEYGISK